MLKNISARELHAIVIRNLGGVTFSRKTLANVLKLDAPSKEFNPENSNT